MDEKLLEIEKTNLIIRKKFSASVLMQEFPPQITNENKKAVFKIACPLDCDHHGDLIFSRWSEIEWSDLFSPAASIETKTIMEENAYQYQPSRFAQSNTVEWYINFADLHLFGYYGGGLFAQDEMQVAEHPILGSLRECLCVMEQDDSQFGPYTRDENKKPTPVLIRGAERRIKVSVDPNAAEGRPYGLYGNNFSDANENAIKNACIALSPTTITNLIAIEAPKYGRGSYSLKTVTNIFNTAFTAFLAAKIESFHQIGDTPYVVIHTGNWGTGAYGGNKTLMALLQIFAARIAKINFLVYHTFEAESSKKYQEGLNILNAELLSHDQEVDIKNILSKIERKKFMWGVSDGN